MKVETQVDGLTQLSSRLRAGAAAVTQPTDAMQEILDRWRLANRARFASGSPWAPLAAVTKAKKSRRGLPTTPLAGGPLENSLTRPGSADAIGEIRGATLTMGTRRHEANLMKGGRGTEGSPGFTPKRPPVLFEAREQREAADTLGRSIVARLASGKSRTVRARGV